MKIFLKIMLSILGVILIGIGILVVLFLLEMKPDKDKEEKVRIQAEQYLKEHFNDNFEIYDTLYDNMGNFSFEYAAKVRDKKSNIEILFIMMMKQNKWWILILRINGKKT